MNVVRQAQEAGLAVRPRETTQIRGSRERITPYLFIAPFVLAFLVLLAIPAIYSLLLSFQRYRGYDTPRWIGFSNYQRLLGYHQFWSSWANTVIYWIGGAAVTLTLAFLLAVLVHQGAIKGKRIYKPVIFLPNVMAAVAASLIFQSIFATQSGVINSLIGKQLAWNQDEFLGKVAVILLRSWHGTGWFFVVFLAGLTTIDPELYDAARVDGANAWHSLKNITLPLMRPTFLFAVVTISISSLRLFAEPNLLFSNGTAPPQFQPIMNQLYVNLQSGEFGAAAAVAWLIFIPIVIVSAIQFRLLRGGGRGEGAA